MTNDYLKDLDDWDDESQQVLLSLAKNNAFISFDEIEKGIFGKRKDSFTKIIIDKKIKRGETHRGLTNVHPFVTQYRSNLDANEIDHRYFVDATKTAYNSLSIITDVDTDDQTLEVFKKEFYIDKNSNGEQDAGEYVFHLIIFQSKDGNKVSEAYKASSQPNSNEIVLYLEQGQDVFSSQKIYARVGDGVRKNVLSNGSLSKNLLWKVLNEQLKFKDKELIFELLEKGQIEGNVIISSFLRMINVTLQILSAPAFAVGWLIEKIGEGIDLLKLPSTIWDVNGEDYFFEKDNLIQKLTISTEKIDQLQQTILDDKVFQAFQPNIIKLILQEMMNKLKKTIDNHNKWVTEQITEFLESFSKNPDAQKLLFKIAILCGIWDGIVDTFSSALIFIGQIGQAAFEAATNIDELLETIDNIFDFLTSGKVWESISAFFGEMTEELSQTDLMDIDLVKMGYILGFGIVFIAGIFIPLTAITKIGKVGSLGAKFGEMLTEVGKAVKAFPEAMKSKTAIQQINRMLEVFSFSEKTRSHAKEIAKEIKKWVVRNRKFIKPKYEEVADLTVKELDWMASRKIGNLGGNILKSTQIRKLRGILKQKGITLIVDGDLKYITKLFKPIDNFKSFEELTLFMKNNGKVGLFHAGTKQMVLTKNCTEIVAFHELCHLKHFEEVGEISYKGFDVVEKEMYVWKQILSNRGKWTKAELDDSLNYINRERKKAGMSKPIKIK